MRLLMLILVTSMLSACVVRPLYPYRHGDYYGHDRYSHDEGGRGDGWRDDYRHGGRRH